VVLREPSYVLCLRDDTNDIMAVGRDARQMLGRTPEDVLLISPIMDGAVGNVEMATALIRRLGTDVEAYADTELPFADAADIADWAVDAMKAAFALGYFTGNGGASGKVYANPQSTITREAAMTILARTEQAESDSDALEPFSDRKKVSDWAKPALTAMVERGIINGIDGRLQPQGNVTRAQVAKMLYAME